MSGGGLPPEAIPPDIVFRCHPEKKNTTVFCAICDNVYHKSDFNRKKNVKYVSNVMVICDEHGIDITSEDNAGIVLTNLRQIIQDNEKTILNITKSYKKLKSEYDKLKNNQESISQKNQIHDDNAVLNSTGGHMNAYTVEQMNICAEENDTDIHMKALKTENELLRDLNNELKDKNRILAELLAKEKENFVIGRNTYENKNKATFTEVLAKEKPLEKKITKLIVRRRENISKGIDVPEIKSYIAHYINKSSTVQAKSVKIKSKDEAIISFMNEESMAQTENILKQKYTNFYKIERESIRNPKVKIIGFDNLEDMKMKDIEYDINKRNFKNLNSKCKVIHVFENQKTKINTILLETTPEIYEHIAENKFRVHIGYQNCRVLDDLNLTPCYNCGRFGHSGRRCKNSKNCLKCAGKHNTINCTTPEELKCLNCVYSNNQFKTNYNTKHVVNDTEKCEVMIRKIKKLIAETNYPVRPHIPKYIGKVNFQSKLRNTVNETGNSTGDLPAVEIGTSTIGNLQTETRLKKHSRFDFSQETPVRTIPAANTPRSRLLTSPRRHSRFTFSPANSTDDLSVECSTETLNRTMTNIGLNDPTETETKP